MVTVDQGGLPGSGPPRFWTGLPSPGRASASAARAIRTTRICCPARPCARSTRPRSGPFARSSRLGWRTGEGEAAVGHRGGGHGLGPGPERREHHRHAPPLDPQGAGPDVDPPEAGRLLDLARVRLAPYEHDDYGAVFAALGAGHAPVAYADSPSARDGLNRLRAYLESNPPPDLHHKTFLPWASIRLDGLMEPAERDRTMAPAPRRRLEPPLPGRLGTPRRDPQRQTDPQRRLRHRSGRLRPAPGRHPRLGRLAPPRRHLTQDQPARLRPLVHPLVEQRQPPLHHQRRRGLRRPGLESVRAPLSRPNPPVRRTGRLTARDVVANPLNTSL
jgi:hypothetical protein